MFKNKVKGKKDTSMFNEDNALINIFNNAPEQYSQQNEEQSE